ncbi:minor capsid protein [Bacillus glycinifermentans]|uniref:putative minor capsid protein n=1 Tax=Bacillus glycinifermentans TaxID=1664069 RepID=UPI001581FE00|nr:putative minor capsid protein [Bacillus glycinifermentans]NUJ19285.1 minor capsid protein [Bacillus glycinifermentans]
MAKPIPIDLLFHSVEYEEYTGRDDGWDDNPATPVTIKNVRVEPITGIVRNNVRDDTEGQSIVFIDRTNSKPFIRPVERSKMTFNGRKYEVNKVKECYDENPGAPHHYEVILV